MNETFSRTEMLLGNEAMSKLKDSKVAVFGVGGVGSFVVEALVRCGIGKIVLVDKDSIDITNINRQIHATFNTIGRAKVEVMKERVISINPEINIETYHMFYNEQTANTLLSQSYDYVVDAIDTITAKVDLILKCKKIGIPIISSMGAGNKMDPTAFKVLDIYETSFDPIAKIIRTRLRKEGIDSLKVVCSIEPPIKSFLCDSNGKRSPGSISFVPSVVGLIIAGEVIKDIIGWKE